MNYQLSRNDAFWAIVAQCFLTLMVFPWLLVFQRQNDGVSFVLGGLICISANILMYRRVFAYFGAKSAQQIVKAFYWGQALKMVLTAIAFAVAIKAKNIEPFWLFIGYLVAQSGFWLGPMLLNFWRKQWLVGKNRQ